MPRFPRLLLIASLALLPVSPGQSQPEVTSEALAYYADCVNEARLYLRVWHLERHILYRCAGDVAISYFNYLGRKRAREEVCADRDGSCVYRFIRGVGRCWRRATHVAEATDIVYYACDVYYEI